MIPAAQVDDHAVADRAAGMLLPEPRGMSGVRVDGGPANERRARSSTSAGTATARGRIARNARRLGVHGARVVVVAKDAAKAAGVAEMVMVRRRGWMRGDVVRPLSSLRAAGVV